MQKLYSEEYERALLGCLLLNNSIIDDVASMIKKDYFQISKNALIYENIINLYNSNNSCDIVMISQALPKLAVDIASLTSEISSTENYEFYARKIKELYVSRKTYSFFKEKADTITDKSINDVLYEADDFINACMTNTNKIEPVDSKHMAISIIEDIQNNIKRKGALEGFDTGYDGLNSLLGGLQLGNLVTIGARPSIGKSAFADQLNMKLAINGVQTCTFSLEMTKKEIQRRRISVLTNIPLGRIKNGFVTAPQVQKINQACRTIYDTTTLLYDSATIGFDFDEIISRIRIHSKQGYKVFFIDHIGLLEYNSQGLKEFEKISQMTKRLKKLASTLNIVIIIVCQLTRDTEGKEPQLNSLRGSGSIEQDSNIVMFLHRARQNNNELSIPTKLMVVKDRDGGCGEINFDFYPATTQFRELDKDGKPVLKTIYENQKEAANEEIPV